MSGQRRLQLSRCRVENLRCSVSTRCGEAQSIVRIRDEIGSASRGMCGVLVDFLQRLNESLGMNESPQIVPGTRAGFSSPRLGNVMFEQLLNFLGNARIVVATFGVSLPQRIGLRHVFDI